MKRSFLYLLVGCLSFGGLGGGTFFYLNGSQETPPSTTMPDDDDDDILESVEQTPQDKFMTNLLASNLKVNKLDVGVNVGGENIAVSFTGALSYDGKELAQGNFEAISASGDLNLKVMDFDETINFSFPGDNTLYFSYMEKDFSISIGSITSIIDLIPLFTTPAVAEEQLNETTAANIKKAAGLDIGSLLNDLTDMLNNIQATETTTGYDFLLEIPDLVSIVLSSDKDFMLTGIKLVNPIEIEGITITLDADVQAYKDQSFVEGPTGEYQSLDTITNVVSTLTDIMETKKLTAKLDVSAHSLSDDSLDLNVKARLSADVNNVTDDFLKGTYELSILPEGILQGNPQPNSVDIRYEHENIYLKVNELLKVKIQNQTLEDVISTVGEYFGTSESTEATDDLLNNLFGGSILMDLIERDFTGIKSSIKDFNSYPEKLEITFAPEFLNSAKEWSIALNFAGKELKSISIIDFTIADFEIDLNLELQKSFVTAAIFDDLSSFQDFKAGASIFKTIAKIIDSKQFLTDFEINLKHKTDLFAFEGEIGADLNGVDFNNIETLLNGTFKISANAKYGEKHKAVSAQLQDQTLYVNFNEILRNSIKGSSITDLIDFITENFGAISLGDSTFGINQIFELLALNAEEYSKIVEQVTKFDFTGLDDYVLINHNNKDDNKITVKIL